MLSKAIKSSMIVAITTCSLFAGNYNAEAEKDRKALVKYFEEKFENPEKDAARFFPYSTDDELKNNIKKGVKHMDFAIGNYAFNKAGLATYDEINEMPPYEDNVDAGAALYEGSKTLQACFPDVTIRGDYPMFDQETKKVVTLTTAINKCLSDAGEKKWNEKKGKMADLKAYFSYESGEAGKTINVKIDSADAAAAYERGKEYYYSQRGYLKLSCANCHVEGAGKRVRNESLSQLLGQVTHFPVYRLKWQGLGTLERRMEGCIKDQGQNPPKTNSKDMKELLYFMSYMSNEMPVDGPDIRK